MISGTIANELRSRPEAARPSSTTGSVAVCRYRFDPNEVGPEGTVSGFVVVTEMISDQRVQPRDPGDPLRQPATNQPAPGLVDDLDVVMGLSPVITDEQHPDRSPSHSTHW